MVARADGEERAHARLQKQGLALGDVVRHIEIPMVDPLTHEMSLTTWPIIFPHEFAGRLCGLPKLTQMLR